MAGTTGMGGGGDPLGPSAPWAPPDAPAEVVRPAPATAGVAPTPAAADRPLVDEPPVIRRPMTISDLLDGAFAIIRRAPARVLGTAAVVVVPLQLVVAFVQRDSYDDAAGVFFGGNPLTSNQATGSTAEAGDLLVLLGAGVVRMLGALLLGALLTAFVSSWYVGRDLDAGAALRTALRKAPGLVVVWLVLSPLTIVAFALCYLPALVPVTFFLVTAPAMVAEDLGPFAAIGRSARLMAKRFGWGALLVLLTGLVATVLQTTVPLLPQLAALALPDPFRWIVLAGLTAAVAVLVDTAVIGATVLFYLDARTRTEGLDLELRLPEAFGPAV